MCEGTTIGNAIEVLAIATEETYQIAGQQLQVTD